MTKQIDVLGVAKQTLTAIEYEKAKSFLGGLSELDRRYVVQTIGAVYKWVLDKGPESWYAHRFDEKSEYASIFAIGSVLQDSENASDIDLLMISNVYASTLDAFEPNLSQLGNIFHSLDFVRAIGAIGEVDGSEYGGGENVVKLNLYSKEGKDIDITFHFEVISEGSWVTNDPFDRVLLFRYGNVNGRQEDSLMPYWPGWGPRPSDQVKINDRGKSNIWDALSNEKQKMLE